MVKGRLTGLEDRRLIVRDAISVLEETEARSTALTAEFSFSHCEGSSDVNGCLILM